MLLKYSDLLKVPTANVLSFAASLFLKFYPAIVPNSEPSGERHSRLIHLGHESSTHEKSLGP